MRILGGFIHVILKHLFKIWHEIESCFFVNNEECFPFVSESIYKAFIHSHATLL